MFTCVNCWKANFNCTQLLRYYNQQNKGICYKCINSLDDNLLSIKVYNHIKEDTKANNKVCALCSKKKLDLVTHICPNHSLCVACAKCKLIMNESYPDELQKCINWTSIALSNCKNCFNKIDSDKRYYLITCNLHFYCLNCIQSIQSFNCKDCEKINEIDSSIDHKKLLAINLYKPNFNVVVHINHASQYSLFFAEQKSLKLSCSQCRKIIQKVQTVIGKGYLKNHQANIIDISASSQRSSSEDKTVVSGYPAGEIPQNSFPSYPNYIGPECNNYSNQNPIETAVNQYSNADYKLYSDQNVIYPNNYNGYVNYSQPIPSSEYPYTQGIVNNSYNPMSADFSNQMYNPYPNSQQFNEKPLPINQMNYAGNKIQPQDSNPKRFHINIDNQSDPKVQKHDALNNLYHDKPGNNFQNANQVQNKLAFQNNPNFKNISPTINICQIDDSSTKSFSK